jgi:outer membrane protein, multidrug efflux system
MHKFLIITASLMLSGCNMAPKHVTPALPTPAEYPPEVLPAGSVSAANVAWQDFFLDERLRALIAQALENNRDLRISVARIEEARGLYRIQSAEQLPQVGTAGSATRSRLGTTATGTSTTLSSFDIGVSVPAFELDFWGRVRNLSDAARAQYLATIAGERAFRIALIRDLSTAYVTSRSLAEQIEQAELAVTSRQEGLRIAQARVDAGVTSALDYRQAEALLTQAQTQLASLRNLRGRQRNIVRLLVGSPIDEDSLPQARALGDQGMIRDIDAGIPSSLLTNRPDIIQAELSLIAARANVGAARAAFFPSISLTGNAGFASSSLDDLFDDDGFGWSFGPSISLPLFDGGARRGNLTVAQAREVIEIATYERTVQIAFREVSDALSDRRFLAEQLIAQERAVSAQTELTRLARRRYDNGVAQFLEVLDAERNLFSAEQALIQLRGAQLNSLITLYAALGGGLGVEPTNLPITDNRKE